MRLVLMRNIQETVLEHDENSLLKNKTWSICSHDLKTLQDSPNISNLILEANPSNEIKELAELIYQSSNQQFCILKIF
jgi:hypothetical protein